MTETPDQSKDAVLEALLAAAWAYGEGNARSEQSDSYRKTGARQECECRELRTSAEDSVPVKKAEQGQGRGREERCPVKRNHRKPRLSEGQERAMGTTLIG